MIEVKSITKTFGGNTAVKDISFNLNKGEIVGLLGPNGAGKSTCMNIITGYISSNEGTILIDGIDILENPVEAKKKIGYLPEIPPLCTDMTVNEYLQFVYEIKKADRDIQEESLNEIKKRVKIQDVEKRLIGNLSKGYKQRIGLAQALVGNPPVLILDEPTAGLDPKQIIQMRELIESLRENHTIILSSHILSEVSNICDRIIILNKGKLTASGTAEELEKLVSISNKILFRVKATEKDVVNLLKNTGESKKVNVLGVIEENTVDVVVEGAKGKDVREVLSKKFSSAGFTILQMKPQNFALENIFLQMTAESEDK